MSIKEIEIKGKIAKTILVLILTCLIFSGCKNTEGDIEKTESDIETDMPELDTSEDNDQELSGKIIDGTTNIINEVIEDNSEIAERIDYIYDYNGNDRDSSLYIAGLKIFEEFSTEEFGYCNEGSVGINSAENILEFYITTSTGLMPASGSITGPEVRFKMDLDTNEIIEKEFTPAPNYAEAAERSPEYINPDSIQYSEKVIELSDEQLIEIGLYFKEYIMEIENSKKETQD